MHGATLLDSGALLALVLPRDPWHPACAQVAPKLSLPLVTTHAVLTEVFHLTPAHYHSRLWQVIHEGVIELGTIDTRELRAIQKLMERYADRPMDFADATLVHLAEREGIHQIFTVDHNDFSTYRIGHKGRFRIVPEPWK